MSEEKLNFLIRLFKYLDVETSSIPTIIETGTHRGHGAECFTKLFKNVYTIELSIDLYNYCLETYKHTNINFLQGKSPLILNLLIEKIEKDYAVYLDAHGSGGDTTFDENVGRWGSPVIEEILSLQKNPPVLIMIDDLSDFISITSYPKIEEITSAVKKIGDYELIIFSELKGVLCYKKLK